MKYRIAYLSGAPRVSTHPEAERTGPRSHVLGVINAFQKIGYEVKPYIVGDRIPKIFVGKGSEQAINSNFFRTLTVDVIRIIGGFINAQKAYKELGGQVDWVYERFGAFQAMGMPFKRHSIPWILETNALVYEEAKFERKSLVLYNLARRTEIKAYQECDVLVCVSEVLKERLVQEAGISDEKILVVPNGVDTDLINPEKYPPKYLFDGFTIGFVGTLDAWQGLDLLINALDSLKKETGMVVNLVVIGDGPMQEKWENLTHQLGLTSQVRFVGRLPQIEVLPILAGCDVGYLGHLDLQGRKVYRSPLKLYEYMGMGKPVLTPILEDTQILVHEGKTGFFFQENNLEEIKQSIIRAYKSRDQLAEMGRKAREEIVVNHTWTARIKTMVKSIENKLK